MSTLRRSVRSRRGWMVASVAVALASLAGIAAGHTEHGNTLTRPGDARYHPTRHPDRIVLIPGADAARQAAVSWRTGARVRQSQLQWTRAVDSPGLQLSAITVMGQTRPLKSGNGLAHHHSVRLSGLEPDTLYAYRVRGDDTWSEWLQFRTAADAFKPFSFLYFGDAQNSVRSHFSRVIRGGFRASPDVSLLLHAGDLVNQREGNHDDEWGEWFEAGGFLHGMVATLPVAGNHEYLTIETPGKPERRVLGPHWTSQFSPPRNGPAGFEDTVYFVRYSGVLFVVLDSMRALDEDGAAAVQGRWLDDVLTRDQSRWVIISHHHPVFSVALGRDNPALRKHWMPIYERHGVDLVLQGHDHAYGRGHNVAEGRNTVGDSGGPVYVVSVAGPKQYIAADSARGGLERIGEDMQLYQLIRLEVDRLHYQSLTMSDRVYDAFELAYRPGEPKRFIPRLAPGLNETRCANPTPPRKTRCWEGDELTR
ncbi:MAG: metallophosphoesterase family protein [Sinobacteraceae bacterium]|nr:metallophosphoesterase family protein [Nevskiaceae bacterium]